MTLSFSDLTLFSFLLIKYNNNTLKYESSQKTRLIIQLSSETSPLVRIMIVVEKDIEKGIPTQLFRVDLITLIINITCSAG